MSDQAYDAELRRLEAALTALIPRVDGIDRDRLMFHAGQASVPRRPWLWPCATAVLAAVSVVLGGVLLLQPGPQIVERVVYVPGPEPTPLSAARAEAPTAAVDPGAAVSAELEGWPTDNGYFKLQQHILRWGLDGLPQPPSAPPPESLEIFLKSL